MIPPLNIESITDLPGGTHFKDVTDLFTNASRDMDMETMLMAEGYTLNEAMSAIEIGDPRMDSGAFLPEEILQPNFDPLTPLLPGEVCWIMDRMFACEMEWHAGYTLSQTVHTCMYMHYLTAIDPDYSDNLREDIQWTKERPSKLISLVMRAATLGMVKCCDLAYRELVKGNLREGEDWQGEKFDVSLCEAMPVTTVLEVIEDAEIWLQSEEASYLPSTIDLLNRLHLRKLLLKLYTYDSFTTSAWVTSLVKEARGYLDFISNHNIDKPVQNSPAYAAFDPHISRKLHSLIHSKILSLPPAEDVWLSIAGLLDGWEEIARLATCESILAWTTISSLRACSSTWSRSRISFMRSTAKSAFSDGARILSRFPYIWLIDNFFLEVTHNSLSKITRLFGRRWIGVNSNSFDDFQQELAKLLVHHVWATYNNRPRYRRHLMKSANDWQLLHTEALNMVYKIKSRDEAEARVVQSVPLSILYFRLVVIRDIILTGFELELYSTEEYSFAYWYLARICQSQNRVLERLLEIVPSGTPASRYIHSRKELSSALSAMSTAFARILMHRVSHLDNDRRASNFLVRYKWAIERVNDSSGHPDPFQPDFEEFLQDEKEIRSHDPDSRVELTEIVRRANDHFARLNDCVKLDETYQLCKEDFLTVFVSPLSSVCHNLKAALSENDFAAISSRFIWNSDTCPWFPKYNAL